jgi:hypothetical protein
VCWNAGVECDGDGPAYEDCHALDRSLDGSEAEDESSSVLASPWSHVWVMFFFAHVRLIAGVPLEGEPVYTTAADPAFVAEHGIGPGCSDDEIAAVPPVRTMPIAESTHSVCADDYDDALRASVGGTGLPFCARDCEIAELTIDHERHDGTRVAIPVCGGDDPWLEIPNGHEACYAWRIASAYCGTEANELVLRSQLSDSAGSFLVTPNPRAPSTTFPDCRP